MSLSVLADDDGQAELLAPWSNQTYSLVKLHNVLSPNCIDVMVGPTTTTTTNNNNNTFISGH